MLLLRTSLTKKWPPRQDKLHFHRNRFSLSSGFGCFNPCIVLEKSVFTLPSFDMSWATRFTLPTKSFTNSLADWFVPCKSEKKLITNKKKDLRRASKSCSIFFQDCNKLICLVDFHECSWQFSQFFESGASQVFFVVLLHPLFSFHYQGRHTK